MNKMSEVAKLLGVEIGEEFEIEGYEGEEYILTNEGLIAKKTRLRSLKFEGLLSGKLDIIKIPKATDRQKEILKALYMLGFRWIAKDSGVVNSNICAYTTKPKKYKGIWEVPNVLDCMADFSISALTELSSLVNWEDNEPLEIEKIIKGEVQGNE